jgi:hypothetical protein
MSAKILTFSSHGETTLLEYDPATADMEEINRVTASSLAARGVPMWSKKKSDTTQAADLEPKNLQTNPPPNPCIGGDPWPTSSPNLASEQRIPPV